MLKSKIISISLIILVCSTGVAFLSAQTEITTAEIYNSQNTVFSPIQTQERENIAENAQNKIEHDTTIIKRDISSITPSIQRIEQEVGSTREFIVPDVSSYPYDYYTINATLMINGPNSLIYSNTTSVSSDDLNTINDSFENVVYPRLTDFFGTPPDIDNNNKTILLIFDIIDGLSGGSFVAGFFYSLNQYFNSELHPSDRYSNEGEILFLDEITGGSLGSPNIDTIAHELQHLIHYGNDEDEETWLDEGASMFAEYLIGGDAFSGGVGTAFQSQPHVSLTYWDPMGDLALANYGAAYTFYLYLAEQYGGNTLIQDMVTREENGISSVSGALSAKGYNFPFNELFRNWTIANFLDERGFTNGSYGYYNDSVIVNIENTYSTSPLESTYNSVSYYGTDYLYFNYPSNLPFTFEFQSESPCGFIATVILQNTTTAPQNTVVIPIDISLMDSVISLL